MTDEPKLTPTEAGTHDQPLPLPVAVPIDDPFDIPTIPLAAQRRSAIPPDDLPEALPTADALPSRRVRVESPSSPRPNVGKMVGRPGIELDPPRPKVFLSLFIIFLMALAAALALTVLLYSIYIGFRTLNPNGNRKKAGVAQVEPVARTITTA